MADIYEHHVGIRTANKAVQLGAQLNEDAAGRAEADRKDERPDQVLSIHVADVVQETVSIMRALSVEKFGVAPDIEVDLVGDAAGCRVIGFSDHVHFPVMEVLKNSVFAMVERWGSASVEDADPIILSVSSNDTHCGVRVSDLGGGLPSHVERSKLFAFYGTTVPPREATYTYSRQFGVPFNGLGVGAPVARLYARSMGGDLTVCSLPGAGCDAVISFDMFGKQPVFQRLA
jgi:signal transduction histidine kinase